MTDDPKHNGLMKATFAHDQCLACIDEIMDRVPNAVMWTFREDGPMRSEGVIPEMKHGEWEIIRKFAQLGWSHYGIHTLTEN